VPLGTVIDRVFLHVGFQPAKVSLYGVNPRQQTGPKARVVACCTADGFWRRACVVSVFADSLDDVLMICHESECAIRHTSMQVPIDTLRKMPFGTLTSAMADDFRSAFLWHMEQNGTKVVDLVRDTGVSRDVINKLIGRAASSTSAENAMLIAAYYGKNVNQFVARVPVSAQERMQTLFDLLQPEERRLLEAQMLGIVSKRDS
jgi:plasmid maintenance system antidote protein VapI